MGDDNYSRIRFLLALDPQVHRLDIESEKNFVIPLSIAEIIATLSMSGNKKKADILSGINIIDILSAMKRGITKFFSDSISR